MSECVRLCRDCADVSALCARLLARESEVRFTMCETCARLCDLCARICSQYSYNHCTACATAAQRCAEACQMLATQHFLMTV